MKEWRTWSLSSVASLTLICLSACHTDSGRVFLNTLMSFTDYHLSHSHCRTQTDTHRAKVRQLFLFQRELVADWSTEQNIQSHDQNNCGTGQWLGSVVTMATRRGRRFKVTVSLMSQRLLALLAFLIQINELC